MYVIFMGPPGAGKGTQAERVARELELERLAPGDLFRQAVKQQSELGAKVQCFMERGELVPDEITIRVILERLDEIGEGRGVILDGFPRNSIQAIALDEALEKQNKTIDRVINIQVAPSELVLRLSSRWLCRECQCPYSSTDTNNPHPEGCPVCGEELFQRSDDKSETVKRRLEVYFKETAPLIDYYRKQNKLFEVEGQGGIEKITERIIKALE